MDSYQTVSPSIPRTSISLKSHPSTHICLAHKINSKANNNNKATFLQLATKYGTDKVTTHSYHNMYQKYLEPMREKKIKMLEIGLGCNMGYGPGASYYLWLEYLPNVELYYIEYDAACAEKWKEKTTGATVFTGKFHLLSFLHWSLRLTMRR